MEITGSLSIGYRDAQGVFHKDFVMRAATLEDVERAIEAAGPGASKAKIRRYEWSRVVTRLGDLENEAVTPEVLASLPSTEYGVLEKAREALLGKLKAASEASGPIGR